MLLGKPWTGGTVWGPVQMMQVTADLDPCRWTGQQAGRKGKESVCGTEAAGVSGQSPPDAGQGEGTASIGARGRLSCWWLVGTAEESAAELEV